MQRVRSMWGDSGQRPAPLEQNAEKFGAWVLAEEIIVGCSPEDAWSLVADISRIGEFSPECVDATWTRGSAAEVGNTFDGTNLSTAVVDGEQLEVEWTRPCTIIDCEPGVSFAYTVGDRYDGTPASDWRFAFEPTTDGRCRIVQTFRHRPHGLSGVRHQADSDPQRADEIIEARSAALRAGMLLTLSRMKDVLEGR